MLIAPLKSFLVERFLNNPSDSGTYYCRAIITNSLTGAVLATLNLNDNGGKYFSYPWTTPADLSGTGLQITISITVYDDSGYSTESVVYGTDKKGYIVRDLAGSRAFGGYAGQGTRTEKIEKIDYKKIKVLLLEAIKEGVEFPDFPKSYDDSELRNIVSSVHGSVKSLPTVEQIISSLISTPEFSNLKTILTLSDRFKQTETSHENLHKNVSDSMESSDSKMTFFRKQLDELVRGAVQKLHELIEEKMNQPVTVNLSGSLPDSAKGDRPRVEPEKKSVVSPHHPTVKKLLGIYG